MNDYSDENDSLFFAVRISRRPIRRTIAAVRLTNTPRIYGILGENKSARSPPVVDETRNPTAHDVSKIPIAYPLNLPGTSSEMRVTPAGKAAPTLAPTIVAPRAS